MVMRVQLHSFTTQTRSDGYPIHSGPTFTLPGPMHGRHLGSRIFVSRSHVAIPDPTCCPAQECQSTAMLRSHVFPKRFSVIGFGLLLGCGRTALNKQQQIAGGCETPDCWTNSEHVEWNFLSENFAERRARNREVQVTTGMRKCVSPVAVRSSPKPPKIKTLRIV